MTVPSRVRIFISYKRNVTPDEKVATEVFCALSRQPQYDVFIDQTMLVGTEWAKRIEQELHRSDYLISFLSENSVRSEMVLAEIETAHHLSKRNGSPKILPVRLAYKDPFVYPLSAYLNPLNWAIWQSDGDTPRLIDQLVQAISQGHFAPDSQSRVIVSAVSPEDSIPPPTASAQILPSAEAPEGTMNPESHFYIERGEVYQASVRAVVEGTLSVMADVSAQWVQSIRTPIALEKFVEEERYKIQSESVSGSSSAG
jgi:hypothetical protein